MSQAATSALAQPAAELVVVVSGEERRVPLGQPMYTVGRKLDRDIILPDTRISREHAVIVQEEDGYYVIDRGSRSGTFVNGIRRERQKLEENDRIDFGTEDVYLIFSPTRRTSAVQFLSQVSMPSSAAGGSDLEKLRLFLEAARQLKTTGLLEDVLVTLLDSTLQLTKAERAFVFLRATDGTLRMAAGRNGKGDTLRSDANISRSILEEAAAGDAEFMVGDTSKSADLAARASIMALDLRTVIAIPLRGSQRQVSKTGKQADKKNNVLGVLYLDSRFASRDLPSVSHDILRAIAGQAAGLLENAQLVEAEEAARKARQEMSIAASIQQRLMTVRIPEVPYATICGRNVPCEGVGGDFFDVVRTREALAFVVTDICGKGVPAALLASVLQGMMYLQLSQGAKLDEAVASVHAFLCEKDVGEKYATMLVARLWPSGALEYVNCGHVPPKLISRKAKLPDVVNPPVGLLPDATFESVHLQLEPGDRFVVVTDGVVEAENAEGEPFGYERFHAAASAGFEEVFRGVREFCGACPLQDDCTVVEVAYRGRQ